ncbi:MAG TPA: hypothetical protein VIL65_15850 [Beijerinckiaceae bacterium]
MVLLREGRLQKNRLSRLIIDDFVSLSGLTPVPVTVSGKLSKRQWFIVADLDASSAEIVAQTSRFVRACAKARTQAGGGDAGVIDEEAVGYALDEKGHVYEVHMPGGTKQVRALQGYVWEALKARLGKRLTKPAKNGYAVDGFVEEANLLIEIKTGVFAKDVYEAVGQLKLYPFLIGLKPAPRAVLLLPDAPLRPELSEAVRQAEVDIHTYSVGDVGEKPEVAFSDDFLRRCGI